MATLADRILEISDLTHDQAEHLRTLCSCWQILADLSFSDLLLYVPLKGAGASDELFAIAAQLRPFTSQTLYPSDMVNKRVTQPEQPMVERAFREGRIWSQEDPVLVDGIPIRMDAVPVRHDGTVIGVVTKEGSPATSRRPGRLEQVYLNAADYVSRMIADGRFPGPERPPGDWPRVGDGLIVADDAGAISWSSPNAVSSLRNLGIDQNVVGRHLDALGLGPTPIDAAYASGSIRDGELQRGDNHVTLRVMPLIEDDRVVGGLVLSRDISEVRQKERVISVKDATIREIHHRVKNNLQTIASLLRLQGRRLRSDEAKAALEESVLRIGSIALVHETLSEAPSDVAEFGEVARRIAHMLGDGMILPGRDISIKVTGAAGPLGADMATPLAVTLTELLHNAIEHAYPEGAGGTIAVELSRSPEGLSMLVRDDGVGVTGNPLEGSRLGLQIVKSLVSELGGTFDITSEGGTRVEVRIPLT
ncbi:MAG: two-component system, sensor histidine kinase PdtaS [Actinomycetota bacterium]|jgi:two-component sensor histidine kinase|nr:two-component system, sensor histidine kinase PdtaS [Actinomycetota bacterium]